MKYSFILFLLFFINSSCSSTKITTISNCIDYSFYYNYKSDIVLKAIKDIPDLKENEQSLNLYLTEGVNFEKIKKAQIIFIPESEFFNNPQRKDDIPLYVLGYIQSNNIKQYLALELNVGQNSSLYIINQVNDKISSMFFAHSSYRSGYGGRCFN